MVKCPNCGIEYDDNVVKCLFCGYNFKETPYENMKNEKASLRGTKFNIRAIFAGTLVYSGLMIFSTMVIILLGLYYPLKLDMLAIILIIPILIGNILACWIGNSTYTESMLNGGIIGILPVTVLLLFGYMNLAVLVTFFVIGSLGGILGKIITTRIVKNPQKDPIEKIRITIVFLFVITGCILSTSMGIAGASNMTYDKNGISFNYIGELVALDNPENIHPFGTGNNLTVIAALNGANNTGAQSDHIIISQGPATLSLQDHVNAEKASIQASNCTIISERNLTVDGVPATEIEYNTTTGVIGMDLLFIKNNSLYGLNFNCNSTNELQRYTVFLMIENSLKVK